MSKQKLRLATRHIRRKRTIDSKTLYLRLLKYARPHWKILLVAILANAFTAALEPILPALFKQMLDEGFVAKNQAWLLSGASPGSTPAWCRICARPCTRSCCPCR